MLKLLTCEQGHYWESVNSEDATQTETCPECGASPEELPLLHLLPSEELQENTAEQPPEEGIVLTPTPLAPRQDDLPLHDSHDLPVVAGYEIELVLGKGPTGVQFFRARQQMLRRSVLLKVVLAREDPGQLAWGSLRGEASALARMHHPHIVQIYEAGERDRQIFYNAVEYLEGPTLADYIHGERRDSTAAPQRGKKARRTLPPREAAQLVQTLAQAIHHAHQCDVIHRNLKPASVVLSLPNNVKLGEQGKDVASSAKLLHWVQGTACIPKLTDFGLARRPVEGDVNDLDLFGDEQAGYLSPEQVWGRIRDIGPATDVYGLGTILYTSLTGHPPYAAEHLSDTLDAVQGKNLVPPVRIRSGIPHDLNAICCRCLTKHPRRRYASARHLAEDLGRYLAGEPVLARTPGALETVGKWMRRQPAVALLLLACLVACVAPVIAYFVGLDRSRGRRRGYGPGSYAQQQIANLQSQLAQEREKQQVTSYRYAIDRAHQAVRDKDNDKAQRYLNQCPDHLRRWEWHYLDRLRTTTSPRRKWEFKGNLAAMTFSPNGQSLIAVADLPGFGQGVRPTLFVWQVSSGRNQIRTMQFPGPVQALSVNREGTSLAIVYRREQPGRQQSEVWCLGLQRNRLFQRFNKVYRQRITDLTFGLGTGYRGDLILLADTGELKCLDARDGMPRPAPQGVRLRRPTESSHLAISSDRSRLATVTSGAFVRVWNLQTNQRIQQIDRRGEINDLVFCNRQQLALAFSTGTIEIVDLFAGGFPGNQTFLRGHQSRVVHLAITPDSKRLASSSTDGQVKVWNLDTREELITLRGPDKDRAPRLAFDDTGTRLAIGWEKEIHIWGSR